MAIWDVIGVGANSVDYVYRIPVHPCPGGQESKVPITDHLVSYGGQTATTLCTCAAMGLRAKYVGVFGSDPGGQAIRHEVAKRGVDLADAVTRDVPNGFAVILLDNGQGERVVLWSRAAGLDYIVVEPRDVAPGTPLPTIVYLHGRSARPHVPAPEVYGMRARIIVPRARSRRGSAGRGTRLVESAI